jgi:hypothetical protein
MVKFKMKSNTKKPEFENYQLFFVSPSIKKISIHFLKVNERVSNACFPCAYTWTDPIKPDSQLNYLE